MKAHCHFIDLGFQEHEETYRIQQTICQCIFRSESITHSARNRSVIPEQTDHSFQNESISDYGRSDDNYGIYWARMKRWIPH